VADFLISKDGAEILVTVLDLAVAGAVNTMQYWLQ